MYQHIYFNIALTSLATFNLLLKSIPELYRWFKNDNHRAFIVRHFTRHTIIYKAPQAYILYSSLLNNQYNSYAGRPAVIEMYLTREFNDKIKNYSEYELLNIDFFALKENTYRAFYWYSHGALHRANDLPAIVKYGYFKRTFEMRTIWYTNGTFTRIDGRPSKVEYIRAPENAIIKCVSWPDKDDRDIVTYYSKVNDLIIDAKHETDDDNIDVSIIVKNVDMYCEEHLKYCNQ